jgi:LysR family glycine cleavage system transcriptional activator
LASQILYQDEARLYCAPSYVKRLKLKATDDIARGTLIHTTLHPHWRSWLNLFSNLNDNQIENIPSLHFDQSIMAIEAARQDQGLVLSSALLTEKEVNEGTLVEPFKQRLALNKSYFVTHDKGTLLRPAVAALKDWLLSNV